MKPYLGAKLLSYFCFSDEHTHTHIYEERPTFGSLVNSYMRALQQK